MEKFPKLYQDSLDQLNQNFTFFKDHSNIIPVYQRKYKWGKETVETLLNDIEQKFNDNEPLWLGTILLNIGQSGKFIIIDGQQRILTMFLIFKIFLNNFKISKIENENSEYELYKEANNEDLVILEKMAEYLENNHISSRGRLDQITNHIKEHKRKVIKNKDFLNFCSYIENEVKCTILILPNDYEFFENINSKSVKLTLSEQCLAFLMSKEGHIFKNLENLKLFRWLVKKNKTIQLKSDEFFKRFTEIYGENTKNTFFNFRKFIFSNKENLDTFLNFLRETKKLIENDDKSFEMVYLKKVCFADYWIIYVRSKVDKNNDFIQYFLKTIWKFDLIRHLNKIAKNSIKKLITNLTKEINEYEYEYHLRIIMKKSENYVDTEEEGVTLSFKGRISDITDMKVTNIIKRLKTLFYVLYCKKEEKPSSYYEFMNNNEDIEYICAKESPDVKKHNFTKAHLEHLVNKELLDKDWNQKFINETIEKKMYSRIEKKKSFVQSIMPELHWEVEEDWWKATMHSLKDTKERIEYFWEERKRSLNKRIELIRKEYLTLEIGNFPEKKHDSKKRQWIRDNFEQKLRLENTEYKNLYTENNTDKYLYFGFFDYMGRKTDRKRMQLTPEVLLVLQKVKKNFNSLSIYGCDSENDSYYEYKVWDKFKTYKGNASLHKNEDNWSKTDLNKIKKKYLSFGK